ncbi:Mediator complex subunit 28 [Musa troglodytarum]|uniref:Mediator complex subunit 28 n=1 Tax=Musa troglodytarum TaxID=320322 RepID=A0A9E7K9U8_9LILI|nr:Mediator complex subunit 28 [Musa troglodytarum]
MSAGEGKEDWEGGSARIKSCKEAVQEDSRSKQNAEILSTVKELGITVHHMSYEMLQHSTADQPSDATTNAVLELLEKHQWSTKLAIVLAALGSSYGKYWLIAQLCLTNPLAFSLAAIKGMSDSTKFTTMLNHRSKALRRLLEKMAKAMPATWELWSLVQKISYIYAGLSMKLDAFNQQIGNTLF